MTYEDLVKELSYVNHSRENRAKYAQMVIENQKLIPVLLKILFEVDSKISCRAAWVLEFVTKKNPSIILPYIDVFTSKMGDVYLDSAVRPIAKICEYLIEYYLDKKIKPLKQRLKPVHLERIIAVNFDYLIGDHKIAPKAYAMQSLYWLGFQFTWIHPELKIILERDYHTGSSGYKARARKILNQIKLSTHEFLI
jgi:hypothetical protein